MKVTKPSDLFKKHKVFLAYNEIQNYSREDFNISSSGEVHVCIFHLDVMFMVENVQLFSPFYVPLKNDVLLNVGLPE